MGKIAAIRPVSVAYPESNDAGFTRYQTPPIFLKPLAERRDHAQTGDRDRTIFVSPPSTASPEWLM